MITVEAAQEPVARLSGVTLRYGRSLALDSIELEIPSARMVGLIGPDGVGKSSLLALLAGTRAMQQGTVRVLGGSMSSARHRRRVCPDIAYMPQGLGRNLYPTLSVEQNLHFFGRLFGHGPAELRRRTAELTLATDLHDFLDRPAGKLSGGMKQKLGLCCALIHDPTLLILDEPTTGVDPLARRQFWELIGRIRAGRPTMSVLIATAYMDEASRFDYLIAMDAGKVIATGSPTELYTRTGTQSLESAFIALMPEEKRRGHAKLVIPPLASQPGAAEIAVEATDLTMQFDAFVAVDHVSFRIHRGEIFGFLGSNGCGKTTTMKMLTGLLTPTTGKAALLGQTLDAKDLATRRRVGYMSQGFSLYMELTVIQNLVLHARLFHVPDAAVAARVQEMLDRFELHEHTDRLPDKLPLGVRQRLSLAVALVHAPEILILDEPTSGVDPIARDKFWSLLVELSRKDRVTIFISTHFMNEGERCDRISLMHAGRVLVSDSPAEIIRTRGARTLEDAFIACLEEADGQRAVAQNTVAPTGDGTEGAAATVTRVKGDDKPRRQSAFSLRRTLSYTRREALELRRDPVRSALALLGSVLMMFVMGYGITLDVESLTFAVLDHDQSGLSRDYALNLSGSRYFVERPPIRDYADLDRRMRTGELSLAIEIPPSFARHLQRGERVEVAAWVDGAMPQRADTISGYVLGIHQGWLVDKVTHLLGHAPYSAVNVETRFRYNPDVRSLPAIVPAVIPLLLLLIPSILTALSVVREKELGSIVNFYATPVTRLEFLLGKQLPYLALGMVNFFLLVVLAQWVFGVPVKGDLGTLALAAFIFVAFSTGFGLLCSSFTRTQIAALFVTALFSLVPAVQFSGLLNPVTSLEGAGAVIGRIYPATYVLIISRGVFSKALGFADLRAAFWPLVLAALVIFVVAAGLLRKQER